jgi:hypothetical protein
MTTQDVAAARWGIAYHSNSRNPRARKWYRVARMVYADGGWFELYWHADVNLRGDNLRVVRALAREKNIDLLPGLFCDMRDGATRRGGEMERLVYDSRANVVDNS